MPDKPLREESKSFLERFVAELTESGDYSTPTVQRANDVKRGVSTYKGRPNGQGAAANAVETIKNRKRALDEI